MWNPRSRTISVVTVSAFSAALLCGCGSLLRVGKFSKDSPQGVPFYAIAGACKQQTVYATPYYRLTLKLSNSAGPLSADVMSISNSSYLGADFQTLMQVLESPTPNSKSVLDAWKFLRERAQPFDPYQTADGQIVLENSTSAVSIVDYSTPYSLNVRKPLSGTSSADYKLATNGTLAEVQGQVADTTLETIAAALPISTLITSAAGIVSKTGAAAAATPEMMKVQLLQEQRYIKKVVGQLADFKSNCPVGSPLKSTDANVATVMSDVGAVGAAGDSSTPDADSIAVSGTIKLPKAILNSGQPTSNQSANSQPNKADDSQQAPSGSSNKNKKKQK
jgi:hypothetical protein